MSRIFHQDELTMGKQDVLAGTCKTETITAERVSNPIPGAVAALAERFKRNMAFLSSALPSSSGMAKVRCCLEDI